VHNAKEKLMQILIIPKGMSEKLANEFLENIRSKKLDTLKSDLRSIDSNYKI